VVTLKEKLNQIREPLDYFRVAGRSDELPTPANILLFVRQSKQKLQQEALQNRSHHRFVLIFNLETQGHVHVDHLVMPLHPGQALLVLPYQFHHFSHLASPDLTWLFITFEMKQGVFLDPMRNRLIDAGGATLEARDHLIDEWETYESAGSVEPHAALLQVALLRLLLELKRDLEKSATAPLPEPRNSLLRAINRLMADSRGRRFGVDDLARELGMSESGLRVRFRRIAGIPLGAYLQNYRLNRAMELLRITDRSIADIAEDAGFGSPQAFSRTFKHQTGQSPREYRQPSEQ